MLEFDLHRDVSGALRLIALIPFLCNCCSRTMLEIYSHTRILGDHACGYFSVSVSAVVDVSVCVFVRGAG